MIREIIILVIGAVIGGMAIEVINHHCKNKMMTAAEYYRKVSRRKRLDRGEAGAA
jgi:hypothetical protein